MRPDRLPNSGLVWYNVHLTKHCGGHRESTQFARPLGMIFLPPLAWWTWTLGERLAMGWLVRPVVKPFVRATNGEIVPLEFRGDADRYAP